MFIKILLFIVLLVSTNPAAGNKIDSLKTLSDELTGTEKAEVLVKLSNEYVKYSDSESAIGAAKKALKIFNDENVNNGIIDSYNAIASAFIIKRNIDSISYYSRRSLNLSESFNYPAGKANALRSMGLGFVYNGEAAKGDSMISEASRILIAEGSRNNYASSLMDLGIANMYEGKSAEAVDLYTKASEIFRSEGDSVDYANALLNIGSLCVSVLGEYDKAMESTLLAQKIYDELNYTARLAYCKMVLGSVYEFTNRIPEAINYYDQAIEIHKQNNNKHMQGVTLNYIGEAYGGIGEHKSAIEFYKKSMNINKEIGHDEGVAIAQHNIGTAYFNMKDYSTALKYFEQTHSYFEKTKDKSKISESFNKIGDVQFKMNKLNEAITTYNRAIILAREAKARELLKNSYEDLALLYENTKNYKDANRYLRLYTEIKDSLLDEQTAKNITEFREKYEAEKRSKEIELLKKDTALNELAYQRQMIIIASLTAFSILLAFAWFKYYNKFRENIRINIKLEETIISLNKASSELTEAYEKLKDSNEKLLISETDLIKSNATKDKFFSIIAHDLRSPINTLGSYISYLLENGHDLKDEEMNELLADLTKHFKMVDKLLESLLNWSVSQFKYTKLVKENFDLNELVLKSYDLYEDKIRENDLSIRFRLSERALVFADRNMTDVVVRNIISNAVRYNKYGGRIEFETINSIDSITCIIRDSGIGMTPLQLQSLFDITKTSDFKNSSKGGTGLGLVICKEFIDKNEGTIEVISNTDTGTEIRFSLPSKS